jgi:flagellar FliJ protein
MKFRFESILKLRKNQENQLKVEMARINNHLHSQQIQLKYMEDIAVERKTELNQAMRGNLDVNTLVLHGNFYQGVKLEKTRQAQIIREVEEKFKSKRDEIVQTMRKRRAMEILKEKDLEEHKKCLAKREIAELDEVASTRRLIGL